MICNFRGRFSKLPKDQQLGRGRLKASICLPIKIKSIQCILLIPQSFHWTQLLLFIYKGEMGFDKIVLISLNRKMICFSCYSQCWNQAYVKKWAAATVLVNNTLSWMYFERRLFGKQPWSFLTRCKHVTTLNLCTWFQFLRAFHSFFKKIGYIKVPWFMLGLMREKMKGADWQGKKVVGIAGPGGADATFAWGRWGDWTPSSGRSRTFSTCRKKTNEKTKR